jgi:hypothetical protein
MPEAVQILLLTRRVNEFLHASYTAEQISDWDPLMFSMVDIAASTVRFVQEKAQPVSWEKIDELLR